jgi:hypothetical protein
VLTANAAVSDALSTAFLVGGVDLARRYCARHEGVMALLTSELDPHPTCVIGAYPGAHVVLSEAPYAPDA